MPTFTVQKENKQYSKETRTKREFFLLQCQHQKDMKICKDMKYAILYNCIMVMFFGIDCMIVTERQSTSEMIYNSCTGLVLISVSMLIIYKLFIKRKEDKK